MLSDRSSSLCLAVALVALAGCSPQPGPTPAASPAAAPAAQAGAAETAAVASSGVETITGTVLETMDAQSYTYVKVKSGSREVWAASGQFKVAVGDTVVVPLETPMRDFHSPSLNRDFSEIYFASRITRPGEAAPASMGAPPPLAVGHSQGGNPHAGMGGAGQGEPVTVTEPIPQPQGGTTVADVWANRKALAGKTVTVRGKVVKFNAQIMGRNWLHIQDGTGKADQGTHDLAVTTDAMVKKGDIVTVTGTVGVDKDFTAGYQYAVIVEGATVR
jgi:hypothetical protein